MQTAFLFDLDGTLLDTEQLWVSATRRYLQANQIPLTAEQATQLVYGRAWGDIHQQVAREYPHLAHLDVAAMGDAVRPIFIEERNRGDITIPGSLNCLRRLSQTNPVAIVSGSPREDIADGIRIMAITSEIAFYLGSEDYTPGKPDPACYLMAASRLNIPPTHCVVFEDSTAGIGAARAASS